MVKERRPSHVSYYSFFVTGEAESNEDEDEETEISSLPKVSAHRWSFSGSSSHVTVSGLTLARRAPVVHPTPRRRLSVRIAERLRPEQNDIITPTAPKPKCTLSKSLYGVPDGMLPSKVSVRGRTQSITAGQFENTRPSRRSVAPQEIRRRASMGDLSTPLYRSMKSNPGFFRNLTTDNLHERLGTNLSEEGGYSQPWVAAF